MPRLYDTRRWEQAREQILVRDAGRCTVARLIGGPCSPTLDVHHLTPLSEGGAEYDDANLISVCRRHHAMLEGIRRLLLRHERIPPCHHTHRYREGREECLRRRLQRANRVAA